MFKHLTIALACLTCLIGPAEAAGTPGTIYKCVDGGRVSYNDRPCGAAAIELAAPQASGPALDALQRLARERAMLQKIEDERAVREEKEARENARAGRAALVERRRCDKLRLQRKWADEDAARAGRDEVARARTKARRQAEALAVECPG